MTEYTGPRHAPNGLARLSPEDPEDRFCQWCIRASAAHRVP
jgi:hypothetical protein